MNLFLHFPFVAKHLKGGKKNVSLPYYLTHKSSEMSSCLSQGHKFESEETSPEFEPGPAIPLYSYHLWLLVR